jgi:predicted nucleic acid-binding protein
MNGKFFLDTNIFVYSFDGYPDPKARRATGLIRRAVDTLTGIVSYQVVQEFFNLALRRFTKPMSLADAEQYLSTVFRPIMTVNSSPALFAEALRLNDRHQLSWYDSLIVAAAVNAGCSVLYTEDLQHGQRFGNLRIENPFL